MIFNSNSLGESFIKNLTYFGVGGKGGNSVTKPKHKLEKSIMISSGINIIYAQVYQIQCLYIYLSHRHIICFMAQVPTCVESVSRPYLD